MSVVLPAPFSPSRAWISPGRTLRSMPLFATTPGYRFVMPRISSAGAVTGPAGSIGRSVVGSVMASLRRVGDGMPDGPAAIGRPVRISRAPCGPLRLVDPAAGVGAGLERAVLHAGKGRLEGRRDVRSEHARLVVEVGHADSVVGGVEQDVACRQVLAGDPDDRLVDRILDVLLGARDDARVAGSTDREPLVDVDADAVDLRGAGGLEDAVAGLAGGLEEDVRLLRVDERLGERLATGRVVERLGREIARHVGGADLDVGLDRLRAELIALDVAHARGAQRRPADRADRAALRGVGRDDAGEIAGL